MSKLEAGKLKGGQQSAGTVAPSSVSLNLGGPLSWQDSHISSSTAISCGNRHFGMRSEAEQATPKHARQRRCLHTQGSRVVE